MLLGEIRSGLKAVLDDIDGLRVYESIPKALSASGVTPVVIAPRDPYVRYSEAAGLTSRNEVGVRLIIVPPQASGAEAVQAELDELFSCGTGQPRSLRTLLGTAQGISAGGTACAVHVLQASVRPIEIDGKIIGVCGEMDLMIEARC